MNKILIFSISIILVLGLLSPFLANSAFGQLESQKEIIPKFNISFNLPYDITYDSFVANISKFTEDDFFNTLQQNLTDDCKSRTMDKDYYTCDKLQFDNQTVFQSSVPFYYVESSQEISYISDFKKESKQTTTWIMIANLGDKIIYFYPKHWGFYRSLVSAEIDAYSENFIVLEKPDPRPIIDSFEYIAQEKIFIRKTVPVNIFILGDDLSSDQLLKLKSKIPSSITPVLERNLQFIGIEYLYDYNIVSINNETSDNLKGIIKSKSDKSDLMYRVLEDVSDNHLWFKDTHPDWIIKKTSWPTELKYDYKLVDVKIVEDFLFSNLIEKKHENEINLIFLDYDLSEIGFLRNYKVTSFDQSTGEKFEAIGLMGYGTEKNLYFIDLYSVPWKQPQVNENKEYKVILSEDFKTLHDCTDCFDEVVSEYSTNFLNHLVNPFINYDPGAYSKINVEILIYQRTGGSQGISNSTLPNLVNMDVLKKELSELSPYVDWTINVTLANKDSPGLHQQIIKELVNPNFIRDSSSHNIVKGKENYQFISSETFRPIMKLWADQVIPKDHFNTTTKTIPVLLVLYNADYKLYIDDGLEGIAYPDDTNPLESCCVFAVKNERDFWNQHQGVTNLLLHELGHVMGLSHPFDYVDKKIHTTNNFWNFYSSPMTYGYPSHQLACGGYFNEIWKARAEHGNSLIAEMQKIDLLEKPCGITGSKFTNLEKSRIFDAMVGIQLQSANRNLQISKADSNQDDMTQITQIESLISLATQEFMNNNKNQLSLQYAVDANEKSAVLLSPTQSPLTNLTPENQIIIPEWIENNAKWWSEDLINDSDFVNGIQFLVQHGIIKVN